MNQIFQLKIEIREIQPAIWRRILVTSNTSFYQLHHIIQIALGWENTHLFQFDIDNKFIGIPDADDDTTIAAEKILLKKWLTTQKQFEYEYDFGDYWCHLITVEDILLPGTSITYPTCIEGARHAPPEDCGGTEGYEKILNLLKNKKSSQRKEIVQWLGGEHAYDPEDCDLQKINKQLAALDTYIRKFEKLG